MGLRKPGAGCRQSRQLPQRGQSSLQPGQEPAQVTPPHCYPGQGRICFAKIVWAKQKVAIKPAPASTRSTFSAWFERSMTFDPRLNLVCNWWLYIESYERANRRNPVFSKQPRWGRCKPLTFSSPSTPRLLHHPFNSRLTKHFFSPHQHLTPRTKQTQQRREQPAQGSQIPHEVLLLGVCSGV